MKVQKTIYIIFKSILYILLSALLFIVPDPALKILASLFLVALGILSYLYGKSNEDISLIAKRNYLIGGVCLIFAILMLFANSFFFGVDGVLAIFLVILAGLQITSVLLSGISDARDNQIMKIVRFVIPIMAIIPAGLILGGYFIKNIGPHGNDVVLAVMFVGAAVINFVFINNQRKIKYTVSSDK